MRKINKGQPSPLFNDFVSKNSPSAWGDLHGEGVPREVYEDAKSVMLSDEQEQLCGYTEIHINEVKDGHIDHYRKRDLFPNLTFDWNNLVVALKDSDFGANYKDNRSGINGDDYDNIFNPVIDNVENYFDYTTWGKVTAKATISEADTRKADKTIEVFNLNHKSLTDRRKNLISMMKIYGDTEKEVISAALENSGFESVKNQMLDG